MSIERSCPSRQIAIHQNHSKTIEVLKYGAIWPAVTAARKLRITCKEVSIMGLLNMERPASRSSIETASRWMLDPLDHAEDDERITLTLRQIVRVTLVATEVGARFQRDGITTDPMAWMLAPRRAFQNLPPVEACITQSNCARAVLIHGLGLDLNIAPHVLDALLDNNFDDDATSDFEQVG